MKWPTQARPLELPDFETQARRLRYQALGLACHADNITRLLLAHHADDQAETVLMRLASGQKGIGLRGMEPFGRVPECQGMHGVSESGFYERAVAFHNKMSATGFKNTFGLFDQMNSRITSSTPLFERGGVMIMRPLLKFVKKDLIDTCKAHGTPWIEDETNQHTWRTRRNTIRSVLNKRQLPVALNRRSLLGLSFQTRARERAHLKSALNLLKQCKMMLLDVRSGSFVLRFPKQIREKAMPAGPLKEFSVSKSLIASLLIRIVAQPVSPYEEIALHTLQYAATVFFPELNPVGAGLERHPNPQKFTAAGVQFERINMPLNTATFGLDLDPNLESQQRQTPHDLDPDHIWALTRQPFPGERATPEIKQNNGAPAYLVTIESARSNVTTTLEPPPWSPWHLWDGRYWIRVMNRGDNSLVIRPFREADLQTLRANLCKSQMKPLEAVLAAAAPGKVRWTLPVISQLEVNSNQGLGKVVALPSLGKVGIIDVEDKHGQRIVDWEIRYKRVMIGKPGLDGMEVHRNVITSWEDS